MLRRTLKRADKCVWSVQVYAALSCCGVLVCPGRQARPQKASLTASARCRRLVLGSRSSFPSRVFRPAPAGRCSIPGFELSARPRCFPAPVLSAAVPPPAGMTHTHRRFFGHRAAGGRRNPVFETCCFDGGGGEGGGRGCVLLKAPFPAHPFAGFPAERALEIISNAAAQPVAMRALPSLVDAPSCYTLLQQSPSPCSGV